ncbi:MAG: sodium:calcium antiporter [Candidatus Hydrogenedentota bacterium]
MFLSILGLIGSLAILTLGAEALVRGATGLARRMGVSSFFIGLTIVGFGTSTPELATGITAALKGFADINIGNVVGSNIFNIALILGLTALIAPIPVNTSVVRSEVWLVIGTAFIPFLAVLTGGEITRWEGALMAAGLVAFLVRGYRSARSENAATGAEIVKELDEQLGAEDSGPVSRLPVAVVLIVVGLLMLVGGSNLLVESSVNIARSLGVSELVIALTIISAGTSAPELVTSLVAALRKQSDISIGNILGSNIFNVLGILGITSIVRNQQVSPQVLWLDTPVMIGLSIACMPIMMSHRKISRAEGAFLLVVFVAYITALFTVVPMKS